MFKLLSVLIFTASLTFPATSQPYYRASWKMDGKLNGIGLIILGSSYAVSQDVQALTVEEIYALDRNDINALDRRATYNYSASASTASDVLLFTSLLLPAIPLIDKKMKGERGKIFLMYAETILLSRGITQLTKNLALRTRPFVYNENVPIDEKQTINARYSFFSGHVSTVSSLTFLSASILNQYHPKGKLMPLVWSAAAFLPLATGYLRVQAGKHFTTDAMVGYATGALIGLIIPRLHLIKKLNENGATIQLGPNYLVINLKL